MDRQGVASFARFVVCGGGVGLASSGALVVMADAMPLAVANAVVSAVSTLLANELHSRITFRRGRASLRVHLESTGTAVAAYLVTTAALLGLEAFAGDAGELTRQAVYLSASALAGIARYAVLKLVVFARTARPVKAAEPVRIAVRTHVPEDMVAVA
jgi:putative flippase GtrA